MRLASSCACHGECKRTCRSRRRENTVKVETPPYDTGFGLKAAEAPGGKPLALNDTDELNPLIAETDTV